MLFLIRLALGMDHTRNQFDIENIPENPTTSRDNFLSNIPDHLLRLAFGANSASAGSFDVLSNMAVFNYTVGQFYQKMKGNEP